MRFAVLASGSSANCTYVESGSSRILIDCGLSARRTEQALLSLGVSPDSLDAILLSHEHIDHIRGLSVFSKKYKLPVFAAEQLAESKLLPEVFACEALSESVFGIGDLLVEAFGVSHDAVDPYAFVVSDGLYRLGHLTDLGRVEKKHSKLLAGVNALVLESNHDPELLRSCSYSWSLKQRIASDAGHLSNQQAASLLRQILHPELFVLVLGHLSLNSNRPELALEAMRRELGNCSDRLHPEFSMLCAPRFEPTALFDLTSGSGCKDFRHAVEA